MPYRPFIVPREIFYGPGALESLATLPGERVLIVTDRGVRSLGLVDRVEQILHAKKAKITVFDQIEPDPSKDTVLNIFSLAQDFQPDLFIGFGGGSPIDGGKGAWVFYEHPDLATRPLQDITQELRRRTLHHKARSMASNWVSSIFPSSFRGR